MILRPKVVWPACAALITAVAAAVGYVTWPQGSSNSASAGLLRPDDPALVRQGAGIYEQACAACHGNQLQGEPDWQTANADGTLPAPPHDQTGHTWHHSDDLLFRITKFGTRKALGLETVASNMPAFEETLTDEDIVAVLSFIKASWPEDIRTRHDLLNRSTDTRN
ncbi:c-type cytochrome [Roseibium sp.]|uniref:c-type cytochrome n=1 Tax=Roseibium sp. TaxID=1936156 RepID=UPI003BAF25CB